jgi:two-component sensor histidine kinase
MSARESHGAAPFNGVVEANHRIANSLALLVGVVRTQARSLDRGAHHPGPSEVRFLFEGIAARIGTIAQLHRLLSHIPADGVTDLREQIRDVTDALLSALSSPGQPVKVVHSGGDFLIQIHYLQPLLLILCEIFINAIKYAHPTGVALAMTVDCTAAADGTLVLTVSDDGVGLPDGFEAHGGQGLGFKVMRSLAEEIGAHFEIVSTTLGLSLRISVPGAAIASAKMA